MSDTIQPVYLVATSRSGANLLRSIVGGHPEISAPAPFETAFPDALPELEPKRRRKYIRDVLIWQRFSPHGLFEEIDPADVQRRMDDWSFYDLQSALYEEYGTRQDTSLWVTKYNGKRFSHVGSGLEFYDDLKLLYLVRDARDVALSFKSAMTGPFHPYHSAKLWRDEQALGRKLLETDGVDVHDIRYEDLLQDPNEELRDVCEFLGVDVVDQMMAYHEREDTRNMAANAHMFENISKPIMSDNFGKFRDQLPDDEVRLVEKLTTDELDYFGYDRVHSREELDGVRLRDGERYESEEQSLAERFSKQMWRDDPREMLDLRLGQRFKFFLHLRYGLLG